MGKNLTLTGMMGVGKSTIGKNLAKRLDYKFVDVDKIIEAKEGLSINSIFKSKSESYFRKIENDITLSELKKESTVIALGGGAFLNKNIRNEILKNHFSFWLNCDSETIIKRIKNNPKRPLAYNLTNLELVNLIKKRSNTYSKASFNVNCSNLTKKQIINKIIKIYETNKIKH